MQFGGLVKCLDLPVGFATPTELAHEDIRSPLRFHSWTRTTRTARWRVVRRADNVQMMTEMSQ